MLVHSEINFILLYRGKFPRDILVSIRANPHIDYRQAQRKPKEYGRVHAISLNNHKILDIKRVASQFASYAIKR